MPMADVCQSFLQGASKAKFDSMRETSVNPHQLRWRELHGEAAAGVPGLDGQPGFIEPSLQFIVTQTTNNLTAVNLLIAIVQVLMGLGFLMLPARLVKPVVIVSVIWALIVWYGGEGMSMLLTGQGSILTGAPGAVLLYPLLGFAIYPREGSDGQEGLLSRPILRWVLAGFWIFAALLQVQPSWWQPQQISGAISGMVGGGGFNGVLFDPLLQWAANVTTNAEIPLNIVLIVVFLALGVGIAIVKNERLVPLLIASIVVSVIFWYFTEAFGMIFTGMATDFNSGLLVVVMALACWPVSARTSTARARYRREVREIQEAGSTQPG
jgi:hypothetical protein